MELTLSHQDVSLPNRRFGIAAKGTALAIFGSFAALMLSTSGLLQTAVASSAMDHAAVNPPAGAVPAELRMSAIPSVPPSNVSLPARLKPATLGAHMMSGMASWYGNALAGHHTASGAIFDPRLLTAAHRTLPFGTRVRVTDQANHRSVIVKINDRGALNADRAIDLSYAAAEKLQMVRAGTHPVRLEILARNSEVQEMPKH